MDRAAYDEQVLVTPAQPAGPECPTDPEDSGDGGDGSTTGGTGTVRPAPRASSTTQEASALPARLAHTGSETAQYALVGVFLLVGGVALSVRARRLQD